MIFDRTNLDKDKYAKWNVYCDANDNGSFDEGEMFETILLYKTKCEKAKISASMNCGSAETTEAVVTTTAAPTCDCEIPDKMLQKMASNAEYTCDSVHGTEKKRKYKMTFSCPDQNYEVSTKALTCKKLQKIPKKSAKNCIDTSTNNCPCKTQMEKLVNKIGGTSKAVCTQYHKKKPTWKVFCDQPEGHSEEHKGKCKELADDFDKDNYQC